MTNVARTSPSANVTYTYDSFGRKVKQIDNTGKSCYYIYDGMDCVFETEQLQYTPNAPIKKRWILRGLGVAPGVGNIIAIQNKTITFNFDDPYNPLTTETITTDYYHSNHRGDIVFTTDEWGSKKAALKYDAFGNTIYELNAENVKYRFSSKEWDSVAQLYYYGFRWYDPAHGIWTTKDPIGISAGDLNVYRMVFNNPVLLVDVYGLAGFWDCVPFYGTYTNFRDDAKGSKVEDYDLCGNITFQTLMFLHCHSIDFKLTVELPVNTTFYIQLFKKQYLIFNCFVSKFNF